MKKSLLASEWILSLSLVILLVSLVALSKFHGHRKHSQIKAQQKEMEKTFVIAISGEVAKPGRFRAPLGSRLGDYIKKCKPTRFANLRSVDFDSPIEKSLELLIAPLTEISIRIEGEVLEALELTLGPGSRICDLRSLIHLSEEADLKFLKSRRMLKDGEVLRIPAKPPLSKKILNPSIFFWDFLKSSPPNNKSLNENLLLIYDLEPVLKTSFQRTIPHSRMPPQVQGIRG